MKIIKRNGSEAVFDISKIIAAVTKANNVVASNQRLTKEQITAIADDVAQELNVSKPYAYKLIRKLNEELKAKGFITIAGRVNRQYFYERLYGAGKEEK